MPGGMSVLMYGTFFNDNRLIYKVDIKHLKYGGEKMKKILIIGLIFMFVTAGCTPEGIEQGNEEDNPPVGQSKIKEADVAGPIIDIGEDGKRILVESNASNVKGQIWVSIDDATSFFEDMPEDIAIGYRDVSRDFQVGNYVEIIIDGGIDESYPMQGMAEAVCVNEASSPAVADCTFYDPQIHGIYKTGVIQKIDIENSELMIRDEETEYIITITDKTNFVQLELESLQVGEEIMVCAEYAEEGETSLTAKEIMFEEEIVLEEAEPLDELLESK